MNAHLVGWALRILSRGVGEEGRGDRGATATEYAILVGFIAVVIVAGVGLFGTQLDGWFSSITTSLPF